jgi:lipopolysaccharide heptosyltransferase II
MAAKEINAAGGIKVGQDVYKLNVIAYDDKANPTEATNAVRKLIDRDGVKYILGFCCSGSTAAVASFIKNEDAVMLVGNAAERSITTRGIPNLVRTRPPADYTGAAAGAFVAKTGQKRIAVLGALDVGFYASYVDAFEKELKKAGGEIIARESFGLKDRDMTPQLTKIRALKPDAILVAGYGGIGDHVRCLALVRHVAAAHPGAPIDFLCRSPTDRVVRFVPELRKAYVDDTPHGRFGLKEKLQLAGRLRREGYRRVYVVSRTLKAAVVPFLAGIPERVGWFGEGRAILINRVRTGERGYPGETEKICGLAGPKSGPCLPPRLVVCADELAAWQEHTLGGAPRAPVLALAPGAYNPHRLWPAAYFADLARRFAARGWQVWVLGGPHERAAALEISAQAPVRDFTGTPLEDAVMQIQQSLNTTIVMITHDVDEAVLLSDRVLMMTNGPAATVGEILDVNLPRPRHRVQLADDSRYHHLRQQILHFLYEKQPKAA